jgi:hypothetical protein
MGARVLGPHVDEHLIGTDVELDNLCFGGVFLGRGHGKSG